MKILITGLILLFTVPLHAQLYSINKKLENKSIEGIKQFLVNELDDLNQNGISLELAFAKNTRYSKHFLFTVSYQAVPIYNHTIKVSLDAHFNIISIKKECPNLALLKNYFVETELSKWNKKNIYRSILLKWNDIDLVKSTQYQIYFEHEKPQIVLQLNAWNKSLDEAILVNLDGVILKEINYARQLLKDTIVSAKVFKPDPLTTLNKVYGGIYIDNNDANDAWINNAYFTVNLPITFDDANQTFYLENGFVQIDDFESPNILPTTNTVPNFIFTRNQPGFEECNIVYHITQFQNYIASIGYDTLLTAGITADAHGQFGADNSVFLRNGGDPTLSFGTGGVDDAEDADVIIHEYCHGISWSANGNDNFSNERAGLDEGLADYFATSYSRSLNTFNWEKMFSWDGHNAFWTGRIANTSTNYGTTNDIYKLGEIWNSAMSAMSTDLGDYVTDRLMLESLHFFTNNTTLPEAALYVLKADTLLFNGINVSSICAQFQLRNILNSNCLPVSIAKIPNSPLCQLANSIGFAKGENSLSILFPSFTNGIYTISDMTGKVVSKELFTSSKNIIISPEKFQAGIYLLTLKIGTQTQTFKIAKW
jgi:hypothetical protein